MYSYIGFRARSTGLLSRSALVQIILHYPLYFHFSWFSVDIASQLVAVPYIHAWYDPIHCFFHSRILPSRFLLIKYRHRLIVPSSIPIRLHFGGRIMREYKEQQQADLLYQLNIKKNENKEGNAIWTVPKRGARKLSRTPRSESNVTIH